MRSGQVGPCWRNDITTPPPPCQASFYRGSLELWGSVLSPRPPQGIAHPATPLDRCVHSLAPPTPGGHTPNPRPPSAAVVKTGMLPSIPTELPKPNSSLSSCCFCPCTGALTLVAQGTVPKMGRCSGPLAARDQGSRLGPQQEPCKPGQVASSCPHPLPRRQPRSQQ